MLAGESATEDDGTGKLSAMEGMSASRVDCVAAMQDALKSVARAPIATGTAVLLVRSQV